MRKMAAMNMTNNTVKVVRATIFLGSIPIEVFQMPNGDYLLSQTQVAKAVNNEEDSFRRFLRSKSPEALPYKDFRPDKLAVEGNNVLINAIPIPVAAAYWIKEAVAGSIIAVRLLGACTVESIERRADIAFGVQRSDAERQSFMEARINGKQTRRNLTDAIAAYLLRHPELSENTKKWMYINASEAVNLQVFNRRANKLAEDLGVAKNKLREVMTAQELLLVQEVEDTAMRMIDNADIEPHVAIKNAATALLIPKQLRVLVAAN